MQRKLIGKFDEVARLLKCQEPCSSMVSDWSFYTHQDANSGGLVMRPVGEIVVLLENPCAPSGRARPMLDPLRWLCNPSSPFAKSDGLMPCRGWSVGPDPVKAGYTLGGIVLL